jgi:hypothetical protein
MSYIFFTIYFLVVFKGFKPQKHRFLWFAFVSVMASAQYLDNIKDWSLWMLGCFAVAQVFAIIERSYTVAILGLRHVDATKTRLAQLEKMGLIYNLELTPKGQKINNIINRIRRFIGSPDNI